MSDFTVVHGSKPLKEKQIVDFDRDELGIIVDALIDHRAINLAADMERADKARDLIQKITEACK